MADTKVTKMGANSIPDKDDLLHIVDDPSGTPDNQRIALSDLFVFNIEHHGAIGDDSTDNATAIQSAIDAAEASGGEVYIPEGAFRFATGLTNTANITIRGASIEKSVLKKVGNIDGITITGNPSSILTRFTLDATGDTANVGLLIKSGTRGRYTELLVQNHGSHGIQVGNADAGESNNLASFRDIKTLSNGGDGLYINGEATPNANAMSLINIDARSNTGWGVNFNNAWANFGLGITAQSNTGGGIRINNARQNILFLYAESNTGDDIELTSDANCKGNIVAFNVGTLVDNSTARTNLILGSKHQSQFEPNFRSIMCDELHMSAEQGDATDVVGNFTLSHPSDRRWDMTFAGTSSNQDLYALNSAAGNVNYHVDGYIAIGDGITAPGTGTGEARIYVDTADGDLKVKFADGTIKTIVVDT